LEFGPTSFEYLLHFTNTYDTTIPWSTGQTNLGNFDR